MEGEQWRGGDQELTHLGLSLPVSVHVCWLLITGVRQ